MKKKKKTNTTRTKHWFLRYIDQFTSIGDKIIISPFKIIQNIHPFPLHALVIYLKSVIFHKENKREIIFRHKANKCTVNSTCHKTKDML